MHIDNGIPKIKYYGTIDTCVYSFVFHLLVRSCKLAVTIQAVVWK